SEGYEVGPNPGVLNAYWAAITKKIRVGQMGYVMSTQNPLRVAEETAILDHLANGRFFVGFARGYQSRWTNVIGQHLGTRATTSPSAAKVDPARLFGKDVVKKDVDDDDINRRIFEEEIDIVVKAWTQESIEYNGKTWQIPFPYESGVDDWPLGKFGVTGRLGAHGEVDAEGNTRRVCVVPSPYTALTLGNAYVKETNRIGRPMALGQNQALVRMPHIGDTMEKAHESVMKYDSDIFRNFYAAMGRHKVEPKDVVKAVTKFGLW